MARRPAPLVHSSVPSISKRIKRITENRPSTAQPPHSDEAFPQPYHARLITKHMVTAHAAARQRRVHDTSRSGPERHVRHAPPFRKEQQIPGLVARAVRRHRDLLSLAELLIAVARQLDSARRIHGLHEPGTIDAPFGAPAPQVRRASEPLL